MGTSRSLLVGRAISTIFSSIARTISVAGGHLVNLRDAIPGLDLRNAGPVVAAIWHAAGRRQR